GNQSPERAASRNSSPLSSQSSSSSSDSTEVFPFEIWYRENSEDDLSNDPYSWVDLEVKKVFSTFTRGSALLRTAKAICQPGPWSVTIHPYRPDEPAHVQPLTDDAPFFLSRPILQTLNVAPTQLHPNNWAFVRAFELLYEDLGRAPSLSVFFWFFSLRKTTKVGWTSLSIRPKRKLLKPFLESFKVFKDRIFKVSRGATGPNILIDNSGDPFFPLHWTPQPIVSVTVAKKNLEEWEKEFVAELHGLRLLSAAEIIKGTGFSVEYLKNIRKKTSQAKEAESSNPQPADPQPAADSTLPSGVPMPPPQVVPLDSPNGSPFQTYADAEERDHPVSAEVANERPRKHLHVEFDDIFDDPTPILNEEPIFTEGPISPSIWTRSTSVGRAGSSDTSLMADRTRVKQLGLRGTLNTFHQLVGCSLIFARVAEAEFGLLDDQVTSLSDQLAQADEENKRMTTNKELLATKLVLEAARESLTSKVEDLSITCQKLEAADLDSRERLSALESDLAKVKEENATKDATILKQGSSILQQYEVGFRRALAQVKVLYPDLDTTEADPYKDIVDGRLVDVPNPPDSPIA
ncbi:hypothetical protein CR513_54314, partial [Mucuna pruriens]